MVKPLCAAISNTELLKLYGYEPYKHHTVRSAWDELAYDWSTANSPELGVLRQIMLAIHLDLCPDDERWRK